jgi:GNAT superfamily N-acetyltransferase
MTWVIRPARVSDAVELSGLAERTFRDTFSALNTAENMDLHCASSFSPVIQATEIADQEMLTVVAEQDGSLVAFAQLHLRPETPACVSGSPAVELRRIYVDRGLHGTGLARDLMAYVLRAAAGHGADVIWLGVWERNPRAIRFYERHGFSTVGDHVFVVGTDPQRDLVLMRSLSHAVTAGHRSEGNARRMRDDCDDARADT